MNKFAGRENTWEYRAAKKEWTERTMYSCLANKEKPKEPYQHADVEVLYYFPDARRHDPDNYAGKFLLDGLTKARVIVDDDMKHIRLHIAGRCDKNNPRTVITIREVFE